MLYYKACHQLGLDLMIINYLKPFLKEIKDDYYFFIFDFVFYDIIPNNFYSSKCNENNTWNFNLNYKSTEKDCIMKDSILFNFGDYSYSNDDSMIISKAKGHIYTKLEKGQAHIVSKYEFESYYDKNKFIGQKILNNQDHTELNIFVIRNLKTKELNFLFVLCYNDVTVNINRKFSNCKFNIINESIFTKQERQNFINYINYIKLDYGRIELIKDDKLGWCIIDVNNSPGKGPISDMVYKEIGNIFLQMMN